MQQNYGYVAFRITLYLYVCLYKLLYCRGSSSALQMNFVTEFELLDYPSTQNRDYIDRVMQHYPDEQPRYAGGDGFVYVAIHQKRKICKIGWSLNPARRERALPRFTMLHWFPADRGVEMALHQRFAPHALGHERFRITGDMADFVEALPRCCPLPRAA